VSTSGYCIRRATGADVDAIARHRVAMFRDMGILDERDAGTLAATSLTYFEDALPSGAYVLGFCAVTNEMRLVLPRVLTSS
jgi:hypothetical protein